MRALYCAWDDGTNSILGREAIPDRTNPKPVDDTLINFHYIWRIIAALLNLPSARMRHIIAPHDRNTFHQLIPWTVVLSVSGIYGPYCILHTSRLVHCECGPICYNTHSSSLVSFTIPPHSVPCRITYPRSYAFKPPPDSFIAHYILCCNFWSVRLFLDRHRVVAWRMNCFGALRSGVVCEARRVKSLRHWR